MNKYHLKTHARNLLITALLLTLAALSADD